MSLRQIVTYAAGWALIQKRCYQTRSMLGSVYKAGVFWASLAIDVAALTQRQALWWLLAHRMPAHGVRS